MLKSILFIAGISYVAIVFLLYLFQRNLMYLPGTEAGDPARDGVPEMHAVDIATEDGLRIRSWYAAPGPAGRVVVFFHGNAGTIADRAFKARHFLDAGYGVMLVGYRGFAGNAGAPSETGLYMDGRAVLRWLEEEGVAPAEWIFYGESLGTGVAVHLAKEVADGGRPAAAVILEAPFTSMADAAAVHYPWLPTRFLVRDRYDSLSKIGDIRAPLLVIHGDRDRTVPERLGRRLYDAALAPKQAIWLKGAGHVDLYEFDLVEPMLNWLAGPGLSN